MVKQPEAATVGQACLFCRQIVEANEGAVTIAGILVAHERCARSLRGE